MKKKSMFLIFPLVAILLLMSGFQDPGNKVLFEKAKYTMETKGDLNGAISLFNDIIKKYPKEREYAAKSQLYIGLCYEKLGVKEARKAYQKVINSYPEQTEAVRLAREKLNLLQKTDVEVMGEEKEFRIKRIKEGLDLNIPGPVSPDGKYMLYADGALDLAVYELATGKKRILVKGDIYTDAYSSLWSPDGKMVAYSWYDNGKMDLRVVRTDGTGSRIIFGEKGTSWLDVEDWSPDGKSILAVVYRKDNTNHLVQVSVGDSSVRVLKNFVKLGPGPVRFSPDGRCIVYSLQQNPGLKDKDIFVFPLDGEKESTLIKDPAEDIVLDWTPDGRGILFRSNRTGTTGLWWIQISNGRSVGTPELVRPDVEKDFIPVGFTGDGSYYFATLKEMSDVYIAEIDFVSGKLLSGPLLAAQRFAGSNHGSDWSPDGKELVYLSQRSPGAWGARTICIRSVNSGTERELASKLKQLSWVRWSPDGLSLLAAGPHPEGGYGTFRLDIQTGAFEPLMRSHIGWPAAWSRDGKAIFSCHDTSAGRIPIVMWNLDNRKEKQLYNLSDNSSHYTSGLTLSSDGQYLAFSVSESGSKIIKILPVNGETARDLLREDKSSTLFAFGFGTVAWAPDGRNVLFVGQTSSGGTERELWLIPVADGNPRKLGLTAENMRELSVHPDGKHIAFTAGKTRSEIWMMENFLPKQKTEERSQLTMRKLENEQLNTPYARISPDGKKIAYQVYAGGSPKRFDILDLTSGTTKVLFDNSTGDLSSLAWSPQSDKIAYSFQHKDLIIWDIKGTSLQTILKKTEYKIYPFDWSRDGKKIVCFFEGEDRKVRIGTVTSEGRMQILESSVGISSGFISEPRISPDGRYVACSLGDRGGNTDIYVWTADDNRKVQVTTHPGRDESPVWSPDGKYMVFLSDRNRSADLWGVQMKDGEAVSTPFIIKQGLGWQTEIKDLTADGKLFLFMLGGSEPANLYTIPVDQKSGNLSGPIAPISIFPTAHSFPRFSPDGKLIAFLSRRGQIGWPKLFLLSENGIERELPLQGHYVVNLAWHPGNRSLIFAGWDKDYNAGIFEVALENEGIKSIYKGEKVDLKAQKGGLYNINFLPGTGKMMFFKSMGKGYDDVMTCDPDGKNSMVVFSGLKLRYWGLPSPNGENICYRTGDSLMVVSVKDRKTKLIGSSTSTLEATWSPHGENLMFREGPRLKVYLLKENTSRILYETPAGKMIGGMEIYAQSWSPDGKHFVFTERDTSSVSNSTQKIFLINPGDGSLKTLGEAPKGYRLSDLRWSPDGSRVVATGNSINKVRTSMYEYWVLENFLPK